jgi:hypothetical protein
MKIRAEVEKLRPDVLAGKSSAYGKLMKLVEQEKKLGAQGGAGELLGEVVGEAKKKWAAAANVEAENRFQEAADAFQAIEKEYMPLDIAKEAREHRLRIVRSDAYKAEETLARAKELIEKGLREKAIPLLEKIAEEYGQTPAADEARLLLTG